MSREENERLAKESQNVSQGLNAAQLNKQALALYNHGFYTDVAQAIEYLNNAVRLDPDYSPAYNNLGLAYKQKGDYDKALEYFQKALKLDLKQVGPWHTEVAIRYNNLAMTYEYKGEYDKAIAYYEKALAMGLKQLGAEHPKMGLRCNNLGVAYGKKGDHDKAIKYYLIALEIGLEQYETGNAEIATVYNNLGSAYNHKGDHFKALVYLQKALRMDLELVGPEHPGVATVYNNLARAYKDKGDYDRAIECYQKALEIELDKLGPDYREVGITYNNLGLAHMEKGDFDRAIEHYDKALQLRSEQSGTQRQEFAALYNNLGAAYQGKGDYDTGIEYFGKALEIDLEQLGPEHPGVAIVYNNLGSAYEERGDYDTAIAHYEKALEIDLHNLGPKHPKLANKYNSLGLAYRQYKGDYDRAIECYKQALEIDLHNLGPEHLEVAILYNNLAVAYQHQSKLYRAKEYYQKALKIGLELLGEDDPHIRMFQDNLNSLRGKAAEGDEPILEDYMDQTDCPECGKTYQLDMRGKHVKRKHKAWVDCECGVRFSYTSLKLRPLKQEDDSPPSLKNNYKSIEDARVGYSLSNDKIKLLGKRLLWVVIVFAVGAYFLNGYLQDQAKERAKKEEAERFERSVRSDVARMVSKFDAVSDWPEKLLKGKSVGYEKILTVELEKLWVDQGPILFIGSIKDISTGSEGTYNLRIGRSELGISKYRFDDDLGLELKCMSYILDSFLQEHPDLFSDFGFNNGVAVVADVKEIRTQYFMGEEGTREEMRIGVGDCLAITYTGSLDF